MSVALRKNCVDDFSCHLPEQEKFPRGPGRFSCDSRKNQRAKTSLVELPTPLGIPQRGNTNPLRSWAGTQRASKSVPHITKIGGPNVANLG